MNATELHLPDGKSAGIWFCEKCRSVAPSKYIADQCCENYKCSECGADTGGRSWLICDACKKAKRQREESDRFAKAVKVDPSKYDGAVYCDGYGYHDDYSLNIEELEDWCDCEGVPLPEYVWACTSEPIVSVSVGDVISLFEDRAYPDWDADRIFGVDDLKNALKKFEDANAGEVAWHPDFSKAIILGGRE